MAVTGTMSLERWRQHQGYDMRQAAEHLGVELSYYYRLEAGKVWPTWRRMQEIYKATGYTVSPNELYAMNVAGRPD